MVLKCKTYLWKQQKRVFKCLLPDSTINVLKECFKRSTEYVVIRTDSKIPTIEEMSDFKLISNDNCKNITGKVRIYKKNQL